MSFEKMQENVKMQEKARTYVDKGFTILGLLGPAGSGKDMVADWLVEKKNFVKVAFADPMKRFVYRAFGIEADRLWGPSDKRNEMFDIPEAWWYEVIGHFGSAAEEIIHGVLPEGKRVEGYLKLHDWLTNLRKTYPDKISTRLILQTLGTEWGRSVEPLMWAEYAFEIIDCIRSGHFYTQEGGIRPRRPGEVSVYFGAVIPDHRFINEVEYTKSHGGYVLRLRRLAKEKTEVIGIANHKSEAEQRELRDEDFHVVFDFEEGVDGVYALVETAFTEKLWTKDITQRLPRS